MENKFYRVEDINANLVRARFRPLDILVAGATGAGKSSTLNALFQSNVAKVGEGVDPETMRISSMSLSNLLRFWDSPGLGDNVEADKKYSEKMIDLLYSDYEMEGGKYGLIDTVLVTLDGSGRDMGTAYKLLNEVIVPNFQADRILVAINQADMVMKGRHWDYRNNCPDRILEEFLEQKVESIQRRIYEATGVKGARPVYYSAEKGYNIKALLDLIIDNMPNRRRELVKGRY